MLCSVTYRWILKSVGDDLTEEDIDAMICDVDTDGSGFVDYDGRHTFSKFELYKCFKYIGRDNIKLFVLDKDYYSIGFTSHYG